MSKRSYSQVFGVVAAIIEKNGKFLLVQESDQKGVAHGQWNHPAGWIDVGENPLEAVKREVLEETGYPFAPTAIIGIYSLYCSHLKESDIKQLGATPHAIKILYAGSIDETKQSSLAGDTSDVQWFTAEEIASLPNLRDPDIPAIIRDLQEGISFPLSLLTHTDGEDVKKSS